MIKTSQTGLSFKKIFTNSDLRAYCLAISSQKRNEENPSYPFWIYFKNYDKIYITRFTILIMFVGTIQWH